MSSSDFSGIEMHGLAMSASDDADGIKLILVGNADSQAKDHLQAFLQEAHVTAQSQGASRVLIDLRHLEFMNSACLKAFVSWLAEVRSLERDKQYRIFFLSNVRIHWQRRSLHALQCFAQDLVQVQH